VGITFFFFGLRHPRCVPANFAAAQIVRDEITFDGLLAQVGERILHANRDHLVADDGGTVGMAIPRGVDAIVGLQVSFPESIAVEVIGREVTVAEVGYDSLAVGHWRWAGGAVKLVDLRRLAPRTFAFLRAATDFLRPDDIAGLLADA